MADKNVYVNKLFNSGVGPSAGVSPYKVLGTDDSSVAIYYTAPYTFFDESTSGLINQTTTLEDFFSTNFDIPETGSYEISWNYIWSLNSTTSDFVSRLLLNGATSVGYRDHIQEPKDSAGGGETLPVIGGGTANTGTNQRHYTTFSRVLNLSAGNNTLALQFACSAGGNEAAIYGANILIRRIQ